MLKQQISKLTRVSPENASHVGLCLTREGLIMWGNLQNGVCAYFRSAAQ